MIKIAAVDDEMHVLERFERMVMEIKELELCGLFETGEQLLEYIKDNPIDAVFMDIEMPGENGLQLSEKILNLNEQIDIIFITAFNQYAVEAFEINAIDYILKPLTEDRLEKTIKRLIRNNRMVKHSKKPYIQCFGDFEVFLNGEALTWKNSKAKEVLAFLVHKEGLPLTWEKIADAVWPNYDLKKAHANFHATTYLLRKRLAEAGISNIIENIRGNYRINKDEFECDINQVELVINNIKLRNEKDLTLLENFIEKGYMEENGYNWAYPRAAELEEKIKRIIKDLTSINKY